MSRDAYNLGSLRGIGSSTRIFNVCQETSPQPWTCIDQFINGPPPPIPNPGKMKTVFLLELTSGLVSGNDIIFKNTLNYYWNTYPQEFTKCPIVDTQGSLDINLSLLDEYYNYGFRRFVGFTSSNILTGVLNWFNLHPEAIGITDFGVANVLTIPKNIYRVKPSNNYRISSITPQINSSINNGGNIYYIYESQLLVCIEIKTLLTDMVPEEQLFFYPATTSNINVDAINSFFGTVPANSIVILLLTVNKNTYINLYEYNIVFDGQQYDIEGSEEPNIPTGIISTKLTNKYNTTFFKGTGSSILWRNGYITLGFDNYNSDALNILTLLNTFATNKQVNNINSHYGILQFDPVKKDTLYFNVLLQQYNGNAFINIYLYCDDPILGQYNATFTNTSPVIEYIQTPSYNPYGKAIALLELTNYSNNIDTIYNESLYYYWYNNPDFPKFPIIDTGSDIENTLSLLDTYYSQGYRIFLGFSRSTVLTEVVDWFNSHPRAVGISLWSTASSLNTVSRNIYRTSPSDDTIVNAVLPYLPNKDTGRVFYIYTEGELAAEDVLNILNSNTSLTVYSYAVDESNLSVTDLQTFFNTYSAGSNDVTVLYIFNNQPYFDLFNVSPTPLTFLGNQYDIVNTQLPVITGYAQTQLDNKLFYIQNTYPNTGLLWRENADYLTAQEGGTITTSTGLCNALSMIDYFQKGKNIGLLGSYAAVLQFNGYKDIMYPSFLFRIYQKSTNSFEKSSISFDDPFLGSFEATFTM